MRLWTASIAPLGASYADLASGCPLFPPTTHQESRIHADGSRLACARHWSDFGGIQRDLCRADQPLSLPGSGPDRALDDNEQSGLVGLGQSEWSPDSAIAAVACGRECAGHGFPIADFERARPAGECPSDRSHLERFRRSGCASGAGTGTLAFGRNRRAGPATGGVLFGWWPALRLSRTQVGQIMQSNARRVATLPCLATSND